MMVKQKGNESQWTLLFGNRNFPGVLFLIYLTIAILFYYKASNGLLVDDGIAGLVKLKNVGYTGFFNSFGFTSLYYFHDLFNLMVHLIAGKSSFGWFLFMVTFHALNATLNFLVFRKFYSILEIRTSNAIALVGSVLFLLSPYQTENVIWAATLHYAIALTIFLISCRLLLSDLERGAIAAKTILLISGLLAVSLMTLEISLVFPFAYCCLAIAVIWNKKTLVRFTDLMVRFLLPLLAIICIYFIATRVVKGHWIPHYGETHLQNNTIQNYSVSSARYFLKLVSFAHFFDFNTRDMIYTFCDKWKRTLALEFGAIALIAFLLVYLKKQTEAKAFVCLATVSFFLLFPSLHMYFMYLFNTENDRLSYFFSLGLYQILSLTLISITSIGGFVLCAGYGLAGGFFLHQQVNKWHEAGLIHANCVNSFVWTTAPKVYILNAPTNYNGVYEFRNNERLPYALDFFKDFKNSKIIVPVLASNYTQQSDSTLVSIVNDSTLQVTLVTNGGWLMNEFYGASDYSNDEVKVDVLEGTNSYRVTIRKKVPGSVFIYSTGNGFKAFPEF